MSGWVGRFDLAFVEPHEHPIVTSYCGGLQTLQAR
jgi:hypothetical protein